MKVENWDIKKITPYARNPRKNDKAVPKVKASLLEFGWQQPIVVDSDGVIIVGHTRFAAANELGMKEVPVQVASNLSPQQIKAYRILDNKTSEYAEWDQELLAAELEECDFNSIPEFKDIDFEIEEDPAPIKDDIVPEISAEIVSAHGDVWILGKHRLICGDSTAPEIVAQLLQGEVPFIMVTDPPYGVEYDASWRLDAGINKAHQKTAGGKVLNDDRASWQEAYDLFPGAVAYVWHSAIHSSTFARDLEASRFSLRSQIIWAKPSLVMGRGHYHWQHEPCWYGVRDKNTANWTGDRKQSTLWQIENMHRTQGNVDDGKTDHSTQKPIECMARPIRNHGSKDDAVYDPFLGSGTTLMACEGLGRKCFGVELNPAYVDLICRRFYNKYQITPIREKDSFKFPIGLSNG